MRIQWLLVCLVYGLAAGSAQAAPEIHLWAEDPLVKVFQDAAPRESGKARAWVARGEVATFQIVVRAEEALSTLKAQADPLALQGGTAAITPAPVRYVGYVNVDRPTQKPSSDQLRKPPAMYPDPLLEEAPLDLPTRQTQPLWITAKIPLDAQPGIYRGLLRVTAMAEGAPIEASFPLHLEVFPVRIESTRLWVTDWFGVNTRHLAIHPEPESDAYYALLRRYAENMAAHRHTVALISPLNLAEFSIDAKGQLAIDFSRFDRWVEIFTEAGVIGRIEGGHIGGRKGGWLSSFVVRIRQLEGDKVVHKSVDPKDPAADTFYRIYFPALVAHLKEKGWLNSYLQHLADEPISTNIDSYRAMAALARTYAPELKIVEACHTKELGGAMDVWVPQLNFLHKDFDHYQARQAAGEEVWFYTCVFPQGEYANRFIEQPLIKTRLLHWINYRYGLTGYLHWGYNHWTSESPFTHTTRPHGGPPYLPAGDPWIVYPGKDGPLDSIRFEAMRDGIVDHELLSRLGEKDPAGAQAFANRFILDFDRYNTNLDNFRAARRQLLRRLSR